jgi:hypothetical protein
MKKTNIPTCTTSIEYGNGSPNQRNNQEIKGTDWKEKLELSLLGII